MQLRLIRGMRRSSHGPGWSWNLAQPRVSGGVPAFWERIPRDLGNQSYGYGLQNTLRKMVMVALDWPEDSTVRK